MSLMVKSRDRVVSSQSERSVSSRTQATFGQRCIMGRRAQTSSEPTVALVETLEHIQLTDSSLSRDTH